MQLDHHPRPGVAGQVRHRVTGTVTGERGVTVQGARRKAARPGAGVHELREMHSI